MKSNGQTTCPSAAIAAQWFALLRALHDTNAYDVLRNSQGERGLPNVYTVATNTSAG